MVTRLGLELAPSNYLPFTCQPNKSIKLVPPFSISTWIWFWDLFNSVLTIQENQKPSKQPTMSNILRQHLMLRLGGWNWVQATITAIHLPIKQKHRICVPFLFPYVFVFETRFNSVLTIWRIKPALCVFSSPKRRGKSALELHYEL